jgi:hypothetical protein
VCFFVAALVSETLVAQVPLQGPPEADIARIEVARSRVRQQALQKHQGEARSARARAAVGSVAVAARCVEGYVSSSQHRASASDVKIVAAERTECESGRCRSYQVVAARDSEQPFDLEVSVTCS